MILGVWEYAGNERYIDAPKLNQGIQSQNIHIPVMCIRYSGKLCGGNIGKLMANRQSFSLKFTEFSISVFHL